MDKNCPITNIIEHLSKKWTLLILKELINGEPKRFSYLLKEMNGISPRTLSKRLKELKLTGLISKESFKETPPRVDYKLTNKGSELIKCFENINKWVIKFNQR